MAAAARAAPPSPNASAGALPLEQHEVLAPGPLHDAAGRLAEPGFARRELLAYDPARIRATPLRWLDRLRLKEWDFYATMTRRHRLSVAVAHGGVAGVVAVEHVDFARGVRLERARVTPLGRGVALPRSSEAGDVAFRGRGGVEVRLGVRPDARTIDLTWPRFRGAEPLVARLVARAPIDHDSIVMATPIGRRGFYYNRKRCGLPTAGSIALGAERVDAAAEGALTTQDWGRGVWPYRTFWLWASGAGRLACGRIFGLNLGAGFGDTRAATENAIFIDGRLSKLGAVDIERDRDDPERPWRFRDPGGRLDLELAPTLFRMRRRMHALVVASDLFQTTGVFRGHAVADDGERIELGPGAEVLGWAEEHEARW